VCSLTGFAADGWRNSEPPRLKPGRWAGGEDIQSRRETDEWRCDGFKHKSAEAQSVTKDRWATNNQRRLRRNGVCLCLLRLLQFRGDAAFSGENSYGLATLRVGLRWQF
jgi:hypothetical protein